jgi:hypothetical protein
MVTVEEWTARLRESVRYKADGPRTRASSTRSSRASRASSRLAAANNKNENAPTNSEYHSAIAAFVETVQGIAKVAIADLDADAGMSETDAVREIKYAFSIASRK